MNAFSRQLSRFNNQRGRLIAVISLGVALIAFMTALVIFVIAPGYLSKSNPFYSGRLGYPSLLRFFNKPIPVEAATVHRTRLSEFILGRGYIEPEELVLVNSKMVARVENVLVEVGTRVRAGDTLILLEKEQAANLLNESEAAKREAEINLEILKSGARPEVVREKTIQLESRKAEMDVAFERYTREKRLFEEGVIAKADLEAFENMYRTAQSAYLAAVEGLAITKSARGEDIRMAEARLDGAKAELESRRSLLEETKILAQTDGVVVERSINPGEVTGGPGDKLLTIAKGFIFKAQVDQRKAGQIRTDLEAEVFLESYPGRIFRGNVSKINPAITDSRGDFGRAANLAQTFSVWIALRDTGESMFTGLSGHARLISYKDSLAVPSASLMHFSGGEGLVFVIENSTAVLRPVRFGISSEGMAEIISGLIDGEQVVVSGHEALKENDRLVIENVWPQAM